MNTSLSITNLNWLTLSTKQLDKAGIGTARLDALILLEDVLKKDRSWILAHPEVLISPTANKVLAKQLAQRASHWPLAFIRRKTEFYGREFYVDERVLEPRPESETMIEQLLKLVASRLQPVDSRINIIDVGTGSGALAITAKLELPIAAVAAIDIDENCLNVARKNSHNLKAKIKFYKGDLLAALPSTFYLLPSTFLLANLPYVPDSHTVNMAALQEPKIAIFGGPDGLDIYRRLFEQLQKLAIKPAFVLSEALPFQHPGLAAIAQQHGYDIKQTNDFIQVFGAEAIAQA